MKTIKFTAATSLIIMSVACGGGGGEKEAEKVKIQGSETTLSETTLSEAALSEAQDSEAPFSEASSLPYFESQTDANCAIHAINMALGDHFISPKYYDKYTMLIGAKALAATRFSEESLISPNQYQALVDFHRTENESEALHIRIGNLKRQFNHAHLANPSTIDFPTYLNYTGILGGMKTVDEVMLAINGIYSLNLSGNLQSFNENNKANLARNLDNISSLVVYYVSENASNQASSSGNGHFFALRKYQNFWYRLNSLHQGPEIIANNNLIAWLEEFTLNHQNVRTLQFTSAQLEEAKSTLTRTLPNTIDNFFSSFFRPESDSHSAISSPLTNGTPSSSSTLNNDSEESINCSYEINRLESASPPSSSTLSQASLHKTIYFEKYNEMSPQDIALGIVHMALGEHFITPETLEEQRLITPDDYERYMNLIAIKDNPRVSGRQRRLMRKYYDGGKITHVPYTPEDLALNWNSTFNDDSISYAEYLHQTGIFGQQKHIENVIRTINGLYTLNLPNRFDLASNSDLENFERIMVNINGSVVVLRREANHAWWLLDSLGKGPELLLQDPKNWLHYAAQFSSTINVLCFTAEDILNIKNSTKNLPALFEDPITNSDLSGADLIEEFFYAPSLGASGIENIGDDLFIEQAAFQNNTYKFLYEFTHMLFLRGGVNRNEILRLFTAFLRQTPRWDSSSRETQIDPATIRAFQKAAETWGAAQVYQTPR